jgi:hypothetical protein
MPGPLATGSLDAALREHSSSTGMGDTGGSFPARASMHQTVSCTTSSGQSLRIAATTLGRLARTRAMPGASAGEATTHSSCIGTDGVGRGQHFRRFESEPSCMASWHALEQPGRSVIAGTVERSSSIGPGQPGRWLRVRKASPLPLYQRLHTALRGRSARSAADPSRRNLCVSTADGCPGMALDAVPERQ